ncbi:hypothetical protein NUU61_005827 [Penicillium alfredii]|uniref:Uncharacterized protein n=1 Tax=Penicillium alfredii TaxID=1506179 RepID=A0A9W9FA72_9EURO|nr:uncharacterized protein NUU61_005827 [Penicillium alfredii]KAJ5096471.1 hypothetical protein NUU61_005827 [Penicillium alfredii]
MAVSVAVPAQSSPATTKNSHAVDKSNRQLPLTRLLPHTLVTTDFDAQKFHAAASLQLPLRLGASAVAATDTRLIASPYNAPAHLLDLETLDTQDRLLALALATFKPIRDDYATATYTESFNWSEVLDLVRTLAHAEGHAWTAQSFYVVVFRSKLQEDADPDRLYALDAHSHQEATASGGLLKYWFGTKDENHQNLATCLWRSREDARLGGRGPWHAQARAAAQELYKHILFTTLKLVIKDEATSWTISDWDET